MKYKRRNIIQFILFMIIVFFAVMYVLYLKDWIDFRFISFGDLNPYGGWSELKSSFIDINYRFSGLSRTIALSFSILLTTLFFGRFFCGFVCPLGTLQDFFTFIGNKFNIQKIEIDNNSHQKLIVIKYFIFLLAIVISTIGLGNIIAPYSPWLAFLNISVGSILIPGLIILFILLLLSLGMPRVFCKYLCPLGAFQSLIQALGFFSIENSSNCKSCNHCLNECPVSIKKPYASGEVSPECISCLSCVERNCIKEDYTYTLNIFNREIRSNQYIALALTVFMSIYFFMPLIHLSSHSQVILNLNGLQQGKYIGTGIGFGGPIKVEVIVEDEMIESINVLNHQESAGYYEEVFKMKSREIIRNQSLSVDSLSGATASSRGFFSAIKSAINQSLKHE